MIMILFFYVLLANAQGKKCDSPTMMDYDQFSWRNVEGVYHFFETPKCRSDFEKITEITNC